MSTVLVANVRAVIEEARPVLARSRESGVVWTYVEVTHEKDEWWMPGPMGYCTGDTIKLDHSTADLQFGFSGIARVVCWRRVT